jgi:hypothetical protein
MSTRTHLATLALTACLAYAPRAEAHICMDAPVSRVGPSCTAGSAQKPGPCGINTRSTQYVTTFKPGETITVEINETINHGSHYRIAFNPSGDDFEDPTSKDDMSGTHPFVLLDGIMDATAAKQSVKVTLPNMTCDNCTLQLIQVMYDKGGNGFGGDDGPGGKEDNDDIYYACADIVLKGTPVADAGAGAADAGSMGIVPPNPDGGAARPAVDAGGGTTGGGTTGGGTAGGGSDSGVSAPLPPGADAGAAGTAGGTSGGGATGGTGGGPGMTDDADDESDGCSVTWSGARRATPLAALVLGVVALLARRRTRS